MEKPDFSNFYKFLVSVGLILIGFSIVLPWLFLTEPFDNSLTTDVIANLTETARNLVSIKQMTGFWLVTNVKWISGIIASIGILIVGYGLSTWYKRQIILDKKEEAELEKLRVDVRPMTASQVSVKALEELGLIKSELEADWSLAIYLKVQCKVRDWISKDKNLLENFKLISNREIDGTRYDLILRAKNKTIPDILVEVRTIDRKVQTDFVRKIIGRTISAKHRYIINTKRDAQTVILFFGPNECLPEQLIDEYKKTLKLGILTNELELYFFMDQNMDSSLESAFHNTIN